MERMVVVVVVEWSSGLIQFLIVNNKWIIPPRITRFLDRILSRGEERERAKPLARARDDIIHTFMGRADGVA